ncbi:MAG TPA: hypothetical protein VES39_03405, partial [Rhodospirillales bacterium]|nr:hypothetical protein [Rhodospirillales bacterium]
MNSKGNRTRGTTRRRLPAAALMLMLAAGCASPAEWQNADVPEAQWSADRDSCQQQARVQADREFALEQQTTRPMNYDRGGQWAGQMNRFSAQQRQESLFTRCMTDRGYRLVPTDSSADAAAASGTQTEPAAGGATG